MSSFSGFDRDQELEIIKARYAEYDQRDRYHLWSLSNPGFSRLVHERDREITRLIRLSAPDMDGRLVDIGSGSSRLAGVAHDLGVHISWLGIDIDQRAVADSADAYPWASFDVASADAIPAGAESVDIVLASVLFSSLPSAAFELAVATEIRRVLRPGGWLIWYDLRLRNPTNRSVHGITRRRLAELFPGWEAEVRSFSLAPPIARRLGRLTPVMYPLLHSVPVLRSHLMGRLRCPT
jgi:SAM-dependent methyltransferase